MKTGLIILSIFFSISTFAQPTVSGYTAPAKDTIIFLPTNSITLSGTAVQANPGHPILDTTWTETSGPAATITNPINRMTTTVTGMVAGSYVFTLTATDKKNSASVTLKITVISGVLPVELAYFNVSKNDYGTLITWQTGMESKQCLFRYSGKYRWFQFPRHSNHFFPNKRWKQQYTTHLQLSNC